MKRFDNDTVSAFAALADAWLASNTSLTRTDIRFGRDAWAVAARCGINDRAYQDRSVTDGHIQTALEVVFPNAVFRDRKTY